MTSMGISVGEIKGRHGMPIEVEDWLSKPVGKPQYERGHQCD